MANKLITSAMLEENNISHFGIIGMRWGIRRASKKVSSLTKKQNKLTKRFDNGEKISDSEFGNLSEKIRKQRRTYNRGISKAERFLAKVDKADAEETVDRYNRDKLKQMQAEAYVASLKDQIVKLNKLQTNLTDIETDTKN